ncbi:MAG: nitrogenase associated protein [Candidatus Bathyarchaeota archaeon]|nr:MAG: nitrogenase associated protein [Candidatus Bathyarchaeota archaeon]
MKNERVVFHGTLKQLFGKVERGDMIPKLQASHAPPCKFWTAFMVINGIRHTVPVIHGPTGCTYSVASAYKLRGCEYRGTPLEPTTCTSLEETNIIYGGEGKLLQAIKEADRKYHPDLIAVLSCCCSGIIGDDVETIARKSEADINAKVIAIRSEGFGGDFRSGFEDAFKAIIDLMEPPTKKMEKTINILGARIGPTYTEWVDDLDEIRRLVYAIGGKINAIIAGGCTVQQIRKAREVELNASWCYDWGQKIGQLIEEKFGVPYSNTGQPYGLKATEEWIMGVAQPLGLKNKAEQVIHNETRKVMDDVNCMRQALSGKTAIIEITEFPGPIRALSLARMAEEFGAYPIIVNIHPYTIKERMPSIKFLLEQGQNPEIILTKGLFSLGTFRSSRDTEEELESIASNYDNAIYLGNPERYPNIPVVNLTTRTGYPHYGYRGIKNMANLFRSAIKHSSRSRSKLYKRVLYG